MQKPTVILRTRHGYTLNAFAGDAITRTLEKHGVYDPNTLQTIRDITRWIKPAVTLDIGANIGNHALILSEHSAQVYAFEPVAQVYQLLCQNIQANQKHTIQAFQLALSNIAGQQIIYLNDDNIGSSSLNAFSGASEQQTIETVTGDTFLASRSIGQVDFIKMDVEGFEGQVIEGLQQTIQQHHPIMLLEWRSVESRHFFAEKHLFETILKNYQVYALGHSASKKSMGTGLMNTLKRLKNKLSGSTWGLYPFSAERRYSNIVLIPAEKSILFTHKIQD